MRKTALAPVSFFITLDLSREIVNLQITLASIIMMINFLGCLINAYRKSAASRLEVAGIVTTDNATPVTPRHIVHLNAIHQAHPTEAIR
jgi:hypothetical protein